MTFYPGDEPRCPSCGSEQHWRDEKPHRKKDRARETCRSGACPLTYPHSVHSAECTNNPRGYYDDLLGEWRVRRVEDETSSDVPF